MESLLHFIQRIANHLAQLSTVKKQRQVHRKWQSKSCSF